jgi:hypothetical protein
MRDSRVVAVLLLLCLAFVVASTRARTAANSSPAARKFALLIGIDTYEPPGTTVTHPAGSPAQGRFAGGIGFSNLTAPKNDVAAMRELLTSEKFGFPNDAEHVHVLLDREATHDAVIAALEKDLVNDRKAGDTVVLYVSSHGSLRVNSKGDGQAYDLDGKGLHPVPLDNTIVVADAYRGADDITNRELRRIFNRAADRHVNLIAIFDSCHSGGQARGAINPKMVARSLLYDPRDLNLPADKNPDGSLTPAPEDRDEVLVLSAAQKDQFAFEDDDANPPHGLFTQALVETLKALPPDTPANDVFKRVYVSIENYPGTANQQPVIDGTSARRMRPLFGGEAARGGVHATVTRIRDDGKVVLDIGAAADIGAGSEFRQANAVKGQMTVLRVKEEELSLARSVAEVVSPAGASVHVGDIVERTKWVTPKLPELAFYVGPANLSLAQLREAVATVRNSGVVLVSDPSYDAWTHEITWNGSNWQLQQHDRPALPGAVPPPRVAPVTLGATLSAETLGRNLPKESIVWLNLPVPTELAPSLIAPAQKEEEESGASRASDLDHAFYVAAGIPSASGVAYMWYRKSGLYAQERTPADFGRGCSVVSQYPLRTDWAGIPDDQPLSDDTSKALNVSAKRLVKLHAWLDLQSSIQGSSDFEYSLALQHVGGSTAAKPGGDTFDKEPYSLALTGSHNTVVDTPRWVYVLGIDCQGRGQVLWPKHGPGGSFPASDGGALDVIPLPGSNFHIAPPFGTDTYILITTATPLTAPEALNFDGVVKGGMRGGQSPLESLLRSASSATRGQETEAPTNWSVQTVQMHSHPAKPDSPHP